jgi:hypothetical protein
MANACKICSHSDRKEIERDLAQGVANLRIATRFSDISEANLRNHLKHYLVPAQLEEETKIEFHNMLFRHSMRLEKLLAAFDELLTDPDDETKYTLSPLADDIDIVYEVQQGERTAKKTSSLQELIDLVNGKGRDIIRVKWADNRYRIFLDTIGKLHDKLDLLAKIDGLYQKEKENDNDVSRWKKAVRQLVENKTVETASEAVELLRHVGCVAPSQHVEREVIENLGNIG